MKAGYIATLFLILFLSWHCAGPDAGRRDTMQKRELSILLLPFSFPSSGLQNALDGPAIIDQAFRIAFRQRGFSLSDDQASKPISLPPEFATGPVTEEMAAQAAVLAGADIVIYGDIVAFGEDLGSNRSINFIAKAYTSRTKSVILRERLSERYGQENPVAITNQLALDFVRMIEDTGQL